MNVPSAFECLVFSNFRGSKIGLVLKQLALAFRCGAAHVIKREHRRSGFNQEPTADAFFG